MLPMAVGLRIPCGATRAVIRWLSERSYALYLVHLTMLEIALQEVAAGRLPRAWLAPPVLVTSAVLAELSFRWLESPILARRPDQFAVEPVPVEGEGSGHDAAKAGGRSPTAP
jgi:peptidoglycan/LPS O-acetylase OafA/YrhL